MKNEISPIIVLKDGNRFQHVCLSVRQKYSNLLERGLSTSKPHPGHMYRRHQNGNEYPNQRHAYARNHLYLSAITHTVRKLHQPVQHPIQRVENFIVRFAKAIVRDDVAEDMGRRDAMVCHGRRGAFDGRVRIRRVLDGGC